MGALEELNGYGPGEATRAVVMRAAGRAVQGFPWPEGFGSWTDDAVAVVVGELFEAKPHVFNAALVSGVETDAGLERFLFEVFRNVLIDQAKATDVGKLRRRFVKVMGDDGRFVRSTSTGETWVLAEFAGATWPGDPTPLRLAATAVRGVYIEKLNSSGPTPAPVRHALTTVAAAVLTAAGGAVPAQVLATVVFERFFPTGQRASSLDAPGGENVGDPGSEPEAEVLAELGVVPAARAVFANLDDLERALLPLLTQPPEDRVAPLDGVGPRETETIVAGLRAKIAQAVLDDTDGDKVVLVLLDLCQNQS